MRNNNSALLLWRLQAHFSDGLESASFASGHEAVDYAQALLSDYHGLVSLTLVTPPGATEMLPEVFFPTPV